MDTDERLKKSRRWFVNMLFAATAITEPFNLELDNRAHAALDAELMEYGEEAIHIVHIGPGPRTPLNCINERRALNSMSWTIGLN